tara:strand:+ start:1630 stop:2097 length:468 start_codon:yes stop_codon:yes gene_type:complete
MPTASPGLRTYEDIILEYPDLDVRRGVVYDDAALLRSWFIDATLEDVTRISALRFGPQSTPLLSWCVSRGLTSAARRLAFVDPDVADVRGRTALIVACRLGCLESVDSLLEAGADTHAVCLDGLTAYAHALSVGCGAAAARVGPPAPPLTDSPER